jgi:membrane protein YqaA with SNARE-associated domain
VTHDAVLLVWLSFVGTLFWVANPDAAVVIYVTTRGRPPLEAALLALGGQAVMLLLLYALGDRLRARWSWLDRQCTAVQARWGSRLESRTLPIAALSGFVGVPPSVPVMLLAAALHLPARHFLPVFFLFRAAWFVTLALVGGAFV